jgi:RimJ/RimL family protein N-acetyltransferase
MQISETDRLTIRELSPDDADALFGFYSQPLTMKFLGAPPASIEEEKGNIIDHIAKYYGELGYGLWGVVLKETGSLIGRAGILKQSVDELFLPEISYLIHRELCGNGFATEAALEVVNVTRHIYKLDRMIAVINPLNTPSIKAAQKCGFEYLKMLSEFKDFGPVNLYVRNL